MNRFVIVLIGLAVCLLPATAFAGAKERFLSELQLAVSRQDTNWLGAHADYPVAIRGKRRVVIKSRSNFAMWDPNQLLTPELQADILAEKPDDLFVNWQGMMIGSGERNIWVRDISPDPSRPDYRIFAIDIGR